MDAHMRRTRIPTERSCAAAASCSRLPIASAEEKQWKTQLKKALICGFPDKDTLEGWKRNGFQGAEASDWKCSVEQAAEARKMAESIGMPIHSVLFGWANVNNPDSFDKDIENLTGVIKQLFDTDHDLPTETLQYLFGVEKDYLMTFYAAVDEKFGSMDSFLEEGLGVDRNLLREKYLE